MKYFTHSHLHTLTHMHSHSHLHTGTHIVSGCPSERAMVLAHIQKQGFLQVIRKTGLRGLFLGFSSTLYRDISFNMVFFTTRELFVRGYRNHYEESPDAWKRVLLGIPAGCMASVVACPFDVVKTRMQGKALGVYYWGTLCSIMCTYELI